MFNLTVMDRDLLVATFNCKKLKTSTDELNELCERAHNILHVQETWLLDTELQMLSSVHKDFYAKGLSAMDSSSTGNINRWALWWDWYTVEKILGNAVLHCGIG